MIFGGRDKKDKYKFKDLRLYSNTQSLSQDTKMYRTVYDESELSYLYFELSLFNKLFDEEDWKTSIQIKVYAYNNDVKANEICVLKAEKNVTKEINILNVREGWGTERMGGFWRNGSYVAEAYVDDDLVGTKIFHVGSIGQITPENNPYFDITSIKLYNGTYEPTPKDKKVYLSQFSKDKTQYIWNELKIQNKRNEKWNLEIFFNFYEQAGMYKSQLIQTYTAKENTQNNTITFDNGWGNNTIGAAWPKGQYALHIVCMGALLAVVPFEVADTEIEGDPELHSASTLKAATGMLGREVVESANDPVTLEEAMLELDELIGLTNVKTEIRNQINYLNFLKLRKEKGFDDATGINLHAVFTGNPGTGKTTVVNLLGKIYKSMGLLSKGHVIEADRADLVGEFIGQTAPRVKKLIESARGGILFIDEAYALARQGEDNKDYGKEVIEVLLKEMSDGPGDIAIMAAGYPKEMNVFLNSNPGMRSRFGQYFHFEDYLPEELMQIGELTASKKHITITDEARELLKKKLTEAYRNRDQSFGNARYATSIIAEAKENLALRCMQSPDPETLTKEELSTVTREDMVQAFQGELKKKLDLAIDNELLKDAMDELNSMVGLQNLKQEINELIKLVKYYREIGRDVLNKFSLHAVFTGNPGTGKTTVARIMAKIYKALGFLERGHLVEVDRQALISGYVGQTAAKAKEMIDAAMGGVLFIDEAYALTKGSGNDYGHEVIETLLKIMEDKRGQFSVIVAGYVDEMNEFLESNPGLKSRFDNTYHFNDYSVDELVQIAEVMLLNESLRMDVPALEYLKEYLGFRYEHRDKYFGNAREVRKVIEKAVRNQHLRLASTDSAQRTSEMIETLTLTDLQEFKMEVQDLKSRIGFKP